MNRILCVLVYFSFSVVLFSTITSGCTNRGSAVFVSTEGKFSVAFPGKPDLIKTELNTILGKIEIIIYRVFDNGQKKIFEVSHFNYPKQISLSNEQAILDGAIEGAVKQIRGKIIKKTKIDNSFFKGVEVQATIDRGFYLGRFAILDNRVYQVYAMSEKSRPDSSMEGFINSFKLNK